MNRRQLGPLLLSAVLAGCGNTPDSVVRDVTAPVASSVPATSAPATAVAPTSAPADSPTATVAPAPTAVAQPTTAPVPTSPPADVTGFGEEVLFLRAGVLTALDITSRSERTLANDVQAFAATPDGYRLAMVRGSGAQSEVWTALRDGSGLVQLTSNDRAEASLSWSPDGLTLAFASSAAPQPQLREWGTWSAWCAASEVRTLDLITQTETTLAQGCDPAFSPDGQRLAYASAPTEEQPGQGVIPVANNSIRLMNRSGQNGWDFARSERGEGDMLNALVLHAPAWSPDAAQLGYQRFVGYQVLVDISVSEIGGAFKGNGLPMLEGAGWQFAPRFSPDGRQLAVSEYNYSDARGLTGYDVWSVTVLDMTGQREVAMPSGPLTLQGTEVATLRRAQQVTWAPSGDTLAVQLAPGWQPDADPNEPTVADEVAGELWLWVPGSAPAERLAEGVQYGSPLVWLPATPRMEQGEGGYPLVYPAAWKISPPTEFEELLAFPADSGAAMMSAAPVASDAMQDPQPAQLFSYYVAEGATVGPVVRWPDGSIYRTFSGTDAEGAAVAGAIRVVQNPQGTYAALYRTTPERWPSSQAFAQALLARSGQ